MSAKGNGNAMGYQNGFSYLYRNYYGLHVSQAEQKAQQQAVSAGAEAIDLRYASQLFEDENGNKFVIFPTVKSRKVENLILARVNEDNTYVDFNLLAHNADLEEAKATFEQARTGNAGGATAKTASGGGGGTNDDDITDVGEVIIPPPQKPLYFYVISLTLGGGGCGDFGDCGGTTGGGGGSPNSNNNNNNNDDPKPKPEDPCETAAKVNSLNTNANNIYSSQSTNPGGDTASSLAANVLSGSGTYNKNWEYGFFVFSNGYSPSGAFTDGLGWTVDFSTYLAQITASIIAAWHNHPPAGMQPPSCADFYVTAQLHGMRTSIQYHFVGSDGATYAITVTDEAKLKEFLKTESQYKDNVSISSQWTGGWIRGTKAGIAYGKAYSNALKSNGGNENKAMEVAQAAVLSELDAGLALSKLDSANKFKPVVVGKDTETGARNEVNCNQ